MSNPLKKQIIKQLTFGFNSNVELTEQIKDPNKKRLLASYYVEFQRILCFISQDKSFAQLKSFFFSLN
jgi:hypothetical protein